jgi:hypothetical protein
MSNPFLTLTNYIKKLMVTIELKKARDEEKKNNTINNKLNEDYNVTANKDKQVYIEKLNMLVLNIEKYKEILLTFNKSIDHNKKLTEFTIDENKKFLNTLDDMRDFTNINNRKYYYETTKIEYIKYIKIILIIFFICCCLINLYYYNILKDFLNNKKYFIKKILLMVIYILISSNLLWFF